VCFCAAKRTVQDVPQRSGLGLPIGGGRSAMLNTMPGDKSMIQNVFEELGFPTEEAENLIIRSDLMLSLRQLIRSHQWTLEQAAHQLKTTIETIEGLLEGDINQFQVEQLITLLSNGGMKVRIEVMAA
jgi:predicted XRE-type DNA-binding protein